MAVLVVARVDDRNHVGVGDARDGARLAAEALELVGLVRHLAVEHLGRHISLQRLVESEVDGRHSARAQLGLQPVSPDRTWPIKPVPLLVPDSVLI